MTMITPSYLGETIEYSSLHACRSTLEDPTAEKGARGPGFINAGVYLLEPGVFDAYALPERFSFETDFLQRHCAELKPRAFITDAYFIDIGVPDEYDRAQREFVGRR